ncbi:MAG: prenyltransferase [Gammaproteobacteria bacterium]|nr:prenyltransferase [Gammaproteobacteria bacterium]MBT4492249.1 prenyltransferase [Gammaproteobacteria bacterium]
MTVSSVIVGILMAAAVTDLQWDRVLALVLGLTMAHATNNLVNDWTDQRMGVDRNNDFRRRYGTHVLEESLVSQRTFALTTLLTGIAALTCAGYLIAGIGLNILYLTLIGALFVFFYTWPLKHFALGELAVLLVWGPLMTAGSYYVLTEGLTLQVFLVSLVVGAGPTLVILGKHMDKYKQDCILTIRTLPVVIGLRASRVLSVLLIAGQWLLITYLVLNSGYGFLACALSLPALKSLLTSLRADRPLAKPDDFQEEVWPLWHSAFAFSYCRNFGFALLLGLIANTIFLSVA